LATLLIELTNRCNLSCWHCFDNRHGGYAEIALPTIETITRHGRNHGFDRIVFTGGEPTLHTQFPQIVRLVHEAGYRFGFVSNGQNFVQVYPQIKPFLDRLETITFSLDGATPNSHDHLRGEGAFAKLMQAVSVCVAKGLPFTFNSVLTSNNRHEIRPLVDFAQQLGSAGVRFGQLMLTPVAMDRGLALNPSTIKTVADQIETLQAHRTYAIGMGPGFYTNTLFPCAALQLNELTITCKGHLALCCHLPDHGKALMQKDPQLDLNTTTFDDAFSVWQHAVQGYRAMKTAFINENGHQSDEHLPCWFCQSYSGQVNWLTAYANNPWSRLVANDNILGDT
jgi:pyruvate-formate lyase-activating enzyme